MMLRAGSFLQDRYEILEQIGSGGMSVVYKAKCHKLNRLVAVKVLKEEFCNDSNFVSKFKMEAQSAAGLSHPNIVSIYDVIDEGKVHYIVMELIEGITLKSYITKKAKLEIKESIGIAIQVAQGIAAAHEQHIVHRDIKPQNMIISKDGKVKVADFGIARAVSAQTMSSAAMGSVHYISPEQAKGEPSDERSDIYSLGVTMYEMVTGRVPFDGENTVAIALAHLENAVVPPSVYTPEIPVSLERIILKCMEKKPERRYASATDVIGDLRQALLHPDGHFVKDSRQAGITNVKPIGDDTFKQMQDEPDQSDMGMTKNLTEDFRKELAATHKGESASGEPSRISRESRPLPGHRKNQQEDEVNPHFERLLAVAGIFVAIIIVIVLIVVFSKLGGVFQSGTGILGNGDGIETEAIESEENGLSDTEVYMPDIRNLPEDVAESQLKEDFLTMKRSYEYSDDIEKNRIISQDPQPGEVVLKGSHINVVISNGSDKIDLTNLGITQLDVQTAQKLIESKNLAVHIVEEENETIPKNQVMRYEPQLAAEGSTVTLYVSSGPHIDTVAVPVLTGETEEDAIALLAEAGLMPGATSTENSDSVSRGSVIRQGIESGTQVELGSKVDYVVSSGPEVHVQRYVASISEVYDLSNLIGPGVGTTSVTIMIRLHQGTDSNPHYKVLTPAVELKGDVLLPINFTSIESIDGTNEGVVEVVEVESGAILKTYPLTFFPMN